MDDRTQETIHPESARSLLMWIVVGIGLLIFLPLVFQEQFRKMVGVALLGIFYSLFLVNLWDRMTGRSPGENPTLLSRFRGSRFQRILHFIVPLRAWGVVPCLIQFVFLGLIALLGWFLGPLFYEITRNPSTLGWIRELLQIASPELYRFVNEITFAVDPMAVIQENAQQIFTNFNRFFSTFIVPLNFLIFTGIGAALYDPIRYLLQQAEGSSHDSRILERYSRLFGEYLLFNLVYNLILGSLLVGVMAVLDTAGITGFGLNLILGLIVFFIFGNLLVPGLGTLFTTAIVVGLLTLWQGWLGGLITFGIMISYFLVDDYAIKPAFFARLGNNPKRAWDFGVEVLILGLILLYASFQLVGALLLFPALCFLDAYLQHQHPGMRLWILSPLKTLATDQPD